MKGLKVLSEMTRYKELQKEVNSIRQWLNQHSDVSRKLAEDLKIPYEAVARIFNNCDELIAKEHIKLQKAIHEIEIDVD